MSVYIFFVSFISNIELTKLFRFNVGKDMLSRSLVLPEGRKFQQRRLNLATVLNFWSLIPRVKATAVYWITTSWDSFALLGTLTQRSSPISSACMGNFLQPKPFGSFKPVFFFAFQFLRAGIKFLETVV